MPDTSKLEKLNRELEKSEKKLRKAINDEKALQHQLKQLIDVIVCAEMDEQWGYVGAKSRQRWLFYAYDRPFLKASS